MLHPDLLLRARLTPPRLHRRVLARPGLAARLAEALDYRLTVVQAGTGYGKTTALAALAEPPSFPRSEEPVLSLPKEGAGGIGLVWYTLDESDADPQQFLSYLIATCRLALPGLSDTPLVVLDEISRGDMTGQWSSVLDALLNALAERLDGPTLLVLDDYHFVAHSAEISALVERLIAYLPAHLHVITATRHPFTLPGMVAWRAKNQMLEIGRADLAFQPQEIEALFRNAYGIVLTPAEIAALADKTEGWPIALQLAWQGLRSGAADSVADLLTGAHGGASLTALFDYLAQELLDRQPPEIATFLRETAVLRELTPEACDAVRNETQDANRKLQIADGKLQIAADSADLSSAALLGRLHELDLFIVGLGEGHYRYHHLFHDFLRERAAVEPAAVAERQRRAARFFAARGNHEEAIHHWLAAQAHDEAAAAIEIAGEPALRAGRLEAVATWIDAIPADVLADRPLLQAYLGDICRLRSRFDEALGWYAAAEQIWRTRNDPAGISRSLHGQAMVYLDTVRPAQAESLLQEAVRLFERIPDRFARARLLELLAENKLNTGRPDEAEALRAEGRALREEGPTEDTLSVRAKIRTGRLEEAQRILEAWAETERHDAERGQLHPPRAHRETVLLLSLIHALRGQGQAAVALAQEGIALGERLNSPFITAVGQMRLGHAWQLCARTQTFEVCETSKVYSAQTFEVCETSKVYNDAIRCYQAAIAIGDRLAVRRTRAEAMWGLTRAYGFGGDLAGAQRAAAEGTEIARWAGDPWVTALTELTLGASYVLAGRSAEAVELLSLVLTAFRNCGDVYGRAATRLWLALAYRDLRQPERLALGLEELLALCETNGYDCLLTSATLVGVPDPRRVVPLLIEARGRRYRPAYVSRLLAQIGLPDIEVHPGYQLRVQTLGAFRVWRGEVEATSRDWQRDKARQLFQLLVTERGHWLQREEIVERLWPDLSPEAAMRDFKVALNALNKAIEPGRAADAAFAFVVREGSAYRLRPEADLWLDAAVFRATCEAGLRLLAAGASEEASERLRAGLALYHGDYLPDALYEDWASEERERLLALYLRTADKLAGSLIERGQYDDGLKLCEAILARDPCWEHAYRLMMTTHVRQGNRPQAQRAYQRCVEILRAELDVPPSAETMALYRQIAAGGL